MDGLFSKRIEESKKKLEIARQLYADKSQNRVFPQVDNVGAIKALVFGEQGIVIVEPCYDDQEPKFAMRLAYPQSDKILQYYSQQTGVDISSISITDDAFVDFALKLFSMKDAGWELTHAAWNHSYSRDSGILYDTMQDAINSIYTDDVFCQQPEKRNAK